MFGSFGKHCGEIGPIHFGGCFPAPGEGFGILRTLDQRVDAVAVQAQFTVEHDGRDDVWGCERVLSMRLLLPC